MVDLLRANLEDAKNAYQKGDKYTALEEALWNVCSKFTQTSEIDISWFEEGVQDLLFTKINTEQRRWVRGYMVAILVHFGCPANQAQLALSEWLGKGFSDETLQKDYEYAKKNDLYREDMESGLDYKICSYISLIVNTDSINPFPKKYKKAHLSYLKAGVNFFNINFGFTINENQIQKDKEIFLKLSGFESFKEIENQISVKNIK